MKDEPLVSVVIACHNGERYIKKCIDVLLHQDYSNFEIIICDDCSTDNSVNIIKELQAGDNRIKALYNDKNIFAGATRNRCIAASRGEYVMIQDIDDFSSINRMKILVGYLEEHQEFDFVSTKMKAFNDNPRNTTKVIGYRREYPTKYSFLWNIPFNHPATVFRRECLAKVEGYRELEYVRRAEDYDLFFRLYEHGYKGANIPLPLYYYRLDEDNYKRRTFVARLQEIRIRYEGYKRLNITLFGVPFLFKPIVAYLYQRIKMIKQRRDL